MFLYVITATKVGYDEFDAVAVIAKDEAQALSMVETNVEDNKYSVGYFYEWQHPLNVKFICKCEDDIESQIVLDSFNAG